MKRDKLSTNWVICTLRTECAEWDFRVSIRNGCECAWVFGTVWHCLPLVCPNAFCWWVHRNPIKNIIKNIIDQWTTIIRNRYISFSAILLHIVMSQYVLPMCLLLTPTANCLVKLVYSSVYVLNFLQWIIYLSNLLISLLHVPPWMFSLIPQCIAHFLITEYLHHSCNQNIIRIQMFSPRLLN